jgi:hypothetical protein
MIINDWEEHIGRTPMRSERTQSWYKAIDSAPCNADVARAPEKEVVENFVAYLRAALLFFPGVEHVLAGHCSNTVDLPALNALANRYCTYTIAAHFTTFDTRATFSLQYKALGTYKLQSILGYEADGGNENAMALRDRKSAHFSAAFGDEVTGWHRLLVLHPHRRVFLLLLLSLNSLPTLVRL